MNLLDVVDAGEALEPFGRTGQRLVNARVAAGNRRDRLLHHGHERGDLRPLFGGAPAGERGEATGRLEAVRRQRVEDLRVEAGGDSRAAVVDGRRDVGRRGDVAGINRVGHNREGLAENAPEDGRLGFRRGLLTNAADADNTQRP